MKIYIERLKFSLLETIWVYENRKMLPQHAESFKESGSLIPLHVIESTLKELNAEGLIDGTEMQDKGYTVIGITEAGRESLKSSGRLFRLKTQYK